MEQNTLANKLRLDEMPNPTYSDVNTLTKDSLISLLNNNLEQMLAFDEALWRYSKIVDSLGGPEPEQAIKGNVLEEPITVLEKMYFQNAKFRDMLYKLNEINDRISKILG
jgi:hypothetical protein